MRALVIHADDLGLHPDVNAAIAAAAAAGTVRSASLLATGDAYDDAVRAARAARLDVGVHLDLVEGRCAASPSRLPWLTGPDGRFRRGAPALLAAAAAGLAPLEQIELEWDAQIRRVRDSGLAPSHLDSHQHVHALPVLFRVAASLAVRHGIPFIRVPMPALGERAGALLRRPNLRALAMACVLPAAAAASRAMATRRGLRWAEHSYGMLEPNLDQARLLRLAEELGPGVNELCVHLGGHLPSVRHLYSRLFRDPATTSALTDPAVASAIARRGVELTSFSDLAGRA